MSIYIGYRNLKQHFQDNLCGGGILPNRDCRLEKTEGDDYLLTFQGAAYAVSKERAEQFINEVLDKCTGRHSGCYPLAPSVNGKETAAVIEETEDLEHFYYDMDDEVLLSMLTALKDESGKPLEPVKEPAPVYFEPGITRMVRDDEAQAVHAPKLPAIDLNGSFCKTCGAPVRGGKFCTGCGAALNNENT